MSERTAHTDSFPDAMTISQLAERTGVPSRRIRYYVSERLLPPPVGRGRAAYYTERHLQRLQQIMALREVNLSLNEIRLRIGEDDNAQAQRDQAVPAGQRWQRWTVIPGVEMHAREDLDPITMSTVRVLVGAVRHVLLGGDWEQSNRTGERE
jgi:DNA-binding transcriptional MerR regulator